MSTAGPEQQLLTREQWRLIEIREDCASGYHSPSRHIASTLANPIGFWSCDCGDVRWTPRGWPASDEGVDSTLPPHRTEAGWPRCATCDGGGCPDCTDPA